MQAMTADTDVPAPLVRWLDSVPAGATTMLVEGEAGIGKTTFLRAGIEAARARGLLVLQTQPTQAEGSLSFAGLSDLLEPVTDELLETLPAPQREALEVALLRKQPGPHPPDPRTTGAATLGCLRALAARGPTLVAVDDVQWLDDASARALAFALRRLEAEPVGTLIARRAIPGRLPPPLTLRSEDARLERIGVPPLDAAAIRSLLQQRSGWTPGRRMLARIVEVCGGNPFFALELGRALAGRGELAPGDALPVPERLRDLVLARLRRLPAADRDVLMQAAALRYPTARLLEQLVPDPVQVREALDRADEAEIASARGDRIVFTHPLYASVLYSATRASRRRSVHARLAGLVRDPEERARHLALAAPGADEDVARALDEAAMRALARGAPSAAAELSVIARDLTPATDRAAAGRRELRAAELHWVAGDMDAALALLDRIEADPPSVSMHATAVRTRGWIELSRTGAANALPFVTRAARIFEGGGLTETAQYAANLQLQGFCETFANHVDDAVVHLRAAKEVAERIEHTSLAAQAEVFLVITDFISGRGVDLETLARGPSLDSGAPVLWWRGMLMMNAGEHDGARRWLERLRDRLADLGEDRDYTFAVYYLGELEFRNGDWDAAHRCAQESFNLCLTTGQLVNAVFPASLLAGLAGAQGDIQRAKALVEEWFPFALRAGSIPFLGAMAWGGGFAATSVGDHQAVVELLEPIMAQVSEAGLREPAAFRFHADLVEAHIALGNHARAQELIEEIEQGSVTNMGGGWGRAVAPRCRALLAAAQGDLDAALRSGEQAVDASDTQPSPIERGRALLVHGTMLRRVKKRKAAREALERAIEIFRTLGASAWEQRAVAELERTGARPVTSSALSPTEGRVARLAADGLTNQQIASALSITVRTVEANLTRIYRKLGVERRAELVARMRDTL